MNSLNSHHYTPNSIRTFTGKVFDLLILDPNSICIEDIAHGLAHTARFGGHLPCFYSVAQHSVLVADKVPPDQKLAALLHDASEAYLGDMPSPFKSMMPEFKAIESNVMKVIASKFGFAYPFSRSVKYADYHLLNLEWNSFINATHEIIPLSLLDSKELFLAKYYQLTTKTN